MQPTAEDRADARRAVHQRLGSAMAAKASDEFCLSTHRRSNAAGQESFAAPAATVVEFGGEQSFPGLPAVSAPDAARLQASLPGQVRLAAALRQAVVAAVRNENYQVVTPVYDEVERLSGGSLRPAPEVLGAPEIPTLITQVCWLNRTIRTWAGPEVLADVVADRAVATVDVPRRLMPDADTVSHAAIALPSYLAGHSGATGDGVTVGVADGECSISVPPLAGRVVHRRNYTSEPWGNPDAHGTAVAGIIAGADPVNGGLAPGAIIYNYKLLATNRFLNGDDFSGALAIQQALEDGVDIINCSWGAGPVGTTLSREARAADAAWAAGMAVVKSAGNRGPGGATMTTPADATGIIVVGGTDLKGTEVQGYSSRGPAGTRPGPDVVAPGGGESGALSCVLVSGGYGDAGVGTSFAAPHVTGLLALYLGLEPALRPDDLRARLLANAQPLPGHTPADQGHGLVQA